MNAIHSKDFSAVLPDIGTGTPPTEIQWAPPGRHKITAHKEGKPATMELVIDARTADRLQAQVQDLREKARGGVEDLPYIDFNHADGEASGFISAVRWGGDDPVTGGVRARIEWTGPGIEALKGRAYRRFSPSFYLNANGEVAGAPVNMGGLVNRAAFKNITPIVAGGPGDKPDNSMEDTKLAADLAAANAKIIDLTSQLAEAQSNKTIQAKDAEITELKGKVLSLENAAKEQQKVDAKSAVAAAVESGKIAPQDQDTQKHFESLYLANPESAKAILAKLPVNPALAGQVVKAKGADVAAGATHKSEPEQFVDLVQAKAATVGGSKGKALDLVIAEQPKLYEAWRNANGQPGL